jgi:hypothetical protein
MELIKCEHLLPGGKGGYSSWHMLYVNQDVTVELCGFCYEALVGRVIATMLDDAVARGIRASAMLLRAPRE